MYKFVLQKTLWLSTWKTNYNAEKCASDVKKMKNHRKQNFEGEANNMQLDKEDTWQSNFVMIKCVFDILILFFFSLCSISLLPKYNFILRYEAWENAIRASSFIKNVPQISAKPIAFQQNLLRKLPRNRLFLTNRFSAKLALKIPAKFPQNWRFFSRICPWKFREIWHFFRNLPEALFNLVIILKC